MRLRDKQIKFNKMFVKLLDKAEELGYGWIIGWSYRPKEVAKELGFENSLHTLCLAIDLELFKRNEDDTEWVYLTGTEDHRLLGEYWETLDEDARWGGRFNDGNHYSLEHNGVM